ncbi:MAG: NADH:flavin oxidoreductase, partial [Desulfobacterales bacterium]|nr:NADH:flavin oxidoreductase [Desulfobacterales bacterium]
MEYIKLFEPISINNLEIKNRIVMPAMGLSYTDNYEFNERYRGFYRERAKGGVGLMTIGPVAIDKAGSAQFMPKLFDDENIETLKNFINELHKETDVKLATQLFHMGRYAFSVFTGLTPIAPSPIPSKLTRETPREMTQEDIEEIKTAYAEAARRAKTANFDFVEILACTGYLISQFLSPVTNKRSDEYGGSIENRMRFGCEVIREVRKAVGDDYPVGIRIAGNDFIEGGHTNKESSLFAAEAEHAGVDAINVTGGWHETNIPQLTTNVPPGAYLYLSKGIKEKVNVPVFASNRLGDPNQAERALRSGVCDMICW